MSSTQDTRVNDERSIRDEMVSPIQSGDQRQLTSTSPPGGFSSMSMLLNLLESVSVRDTGRKEDFSSSRNRDHGGSTSFQRSYTAQRHDSQLSGAKGDGHRDDMNRSKGNRITGRWKTPSGSSFPVSEDAGKQRGFHPSGGADSLNKGFHSNSDTTLYNPDVSSLKLMGTKNLVNEPARNAAFTPLGLSKNDRTVSCTLLQPPCNIEPHTSLETTSVDSSLNTKKNAEVTASNRRKGDLELQLGSTPPNFLSGSVQGTPVGNTVVRSEGAWRPSHSLDPRTSITRKMKGLLNKLTVENFPIVGDQVTALMGGCDDWDLLNELLDLVLDKAFNEPDFSQLYADLCLIISYCNPLFSAPSSTTSGKTTQQSTFSSIIIKKWGDEFDKLPTKLDLTPEQKSTLTVDDQDIEIMKMKTRMRGLCVSFGEFLLRRIVSMRGFNVASCVLLGDEHPHECLVEGLCQMLTTAGAYLDKDPVGKLLLENAFGRLQELKANGLLSKRISCLVQDLFDARRVQWHRRVHRERAKGLSQIKQDAENADLVGGSAVRAQYGFVVQLGQRSNLVDNVEYAKYMQKKEEEYLQRMKV